MSTSTLRVIIGIILFGHGLGHALAVLPAVGFKLSQSHSLDSWLFTGPFGNTAAKIIGIVFFITALLTFIGAALALIGWFIPHHIWQPLAVLAAAISFIGLIFFWNAFPFLFPNKIGVIIVDAAVLISLLWVHWPKF